jgi:hypothetical protein
MSFGNDSAHTPQCYSIIVAQGHTWTATVDAPLWYLQLNNTGSGDGTAQFNGDSGAVFTLYHGNTQIFNGRDLDCTVLKISNPVSGASALNVDLILSYVKSAPVVTTT